MEMPESKNRDIPFAYCFHPWHLLDNYYTGKGPSILLSISQQTKTFPRSSPWYINYNGYFMGDVITTTKNKNIMIT